MKNFRLLGESRMFEGVKVYRIECTTEFENQGCTIRVGQRGGWVEREDNLGGCGWIYPKAVALNYSLVSDNSCLVDTAVVRDSAWVLGDSRVGGNASLSQKAKVIGEAKIWGEVRISGRTIVSGSAKIFGNLLITGDSLFTDNSVAFGYGVLNSKCLSGTNTYIGGREII
ncbi:MAG: hypothetical protein ACRCZ0_08595 [Cetobacterium sp.]